MSGDLLGETSSRQVNGRESHGVSFWHRDTLLYSQVSEDPPCGLCGAPGVCFRLGRDAGTGWTSAEPHELELGLQGLSALQRSFTCLQPAGEDFR